MESEMRVGQIRQLLENDLLNIIDSDYIYLDFPIHYNIGDILIAKGAFELLKKSKFRCKYYASSIHFNDSKVPNDCIIILHGGGNFGDLYRYENEFRNIIIKKFPNHKIVLFPQTVYYKCSDYLNIDKKIYSTHKNLTIIARDTVSFFFLKENFNQNKILMYPDTAFCIEFPTYIKNKSIRKNLYFKRKDNELGHELTENLHQYDIYDWDKVLDKKTFNAVIFGSKIISKIRRSQVKKFVDLRIMQDWYVLNVIYPYCIRKATQFFQQYEKIYTTRLHGAILSQLLGIPYVVLDNSYGKNSNFFKTWFYDDLAPYSEIKS